MAEIITVPLGDRSYPIIIGSDILDLLGRKLEDVGFPKRVAVISNPTIDALYGDRIVESLTAKGFNVLRYNVPDGEEYKNLETLHGIYDALIGHHFDRGSGIIALGGGVVGDMAGYAAATFLRGIPYAQVPTTVLSQVDSSVGGKTAVNHPLGKNLIGAFYQPELVLIDIDTLNTLEEREVSAGLAEVVKYGVTFDAHFFEWLEDNVSRLRTRDPEALIFAIKKACQLKADIVARDEKEGSVRAFLNYGHTFGHAVESLAGYGQWKHGEAVAVGMVIAAQLAMKAGLCADEDVARISTLLQQLDLPVVPPAYPLSAYVESMLRDKKVRAGQLTMVLNVGIGQAELRQVNDLQKQLADVLV